MSAFAAWVFSLMTALATTEHVTPPPELAESIARAAEAHPLDGEHGSERMGAILVAIGFAESRYKLDAVGDLGQSLGPFQISKAWARPTRDLDGEADLAARLVATSFRICAARPLAEKLSWYAVGQTGCNPRGAPASRWRMHLASVLLRDHPPAPRPQRVD